MTPYDVVAARYAMPPHINREQFQVDVVNALAPLNEEGFWLDMGTGKTLCATFAALFHRITWGATCVVIMPPILIRQWGIWLRSITPTPSVVEYRGTPKERSKLQLGADFVLVGIQIFKLDFDRFTSFYQDRNVIVVNDEATMLSNVGSDNHDKVYEFCTGRPRLLLTGTPANKPTDAYGLMKFTAPGLYRNLKHFESLHVKERDFFGNPSEYQNLDILHQNLLTNSVRVLYEDAYKDIQEPQFVPVEYDLDPAHLKLYRKLAEEEMLKLPDGGKIDATSSNKLIHALGQIAMNWGHFSGNPRDLAAGIKLVQQSLDELGDGKLMVFANYRMTVALLVAAFAKYGAVGINSEVNDRQKALNLESFISDPNCRLIVVQFKSGGMGLDGMQHVCNHMVWVEPCQQPRDFHQGVARLKRKGQKKRVVVKLAIAAGTLQIRGFHSLLANDSVVNQVVRNATDLRKVIFGES